MPIEIIILIVVSVIIVMTIAGIIVVTKQTNRFSSFSKWFDFKTVAWKNIADDQRYGYLELAIDKLLKENSGAATIDELIDKIPDYVSFDNQDELKHCHDYLKKKYLPRDSTNSTNNRKRTG